MKRVFVSGLTLALLAIFVITTMIPWSPLNSLRTEIDINSGRLRRTRYIAYLQVYQSVEDTPFSRAAERNEGVPQWHTTDVVSPPFINSSPSYVFGAARSQTKELEFLWDSLEADPEFRRKSAEQLMALWQAEGSTHAAYLLLYSWDEFPHKEELSATTPLRLESSLLPQQQIRDGTITRTFFYPDHKPLMRVEGYLDFERPIRHERPHRHLAPQREDGIAPVLQGGGP